MTPSIMTLSITSLNIKALDRECFILSVLCLMSFMPRVTFAECSKCVLFLYANCHYAECHNAKFNYAQCRYIKCNGDRLD